MSGVALKRICELVTEAGPEEERPFVALEHVVSGTGQLEKDVELPRRLPGSSHAAVSPGDVLFGKLRPYLAKTLRISEPMFASTELMALRPTLNVDSRWLHYLLMGDQVMGWAVATSDGSKMPRTSWSDLGEFRVSVPEVREQRAIADYLDAETARIDALIEKKEHLRQRLQERRDSATESVILDAEGPQRPIAALAEYINGWPFKPTDFDSEGLPVIRIQQLVNSEAEPDRFQGKLPEHVLLRDGDLVFSWSGSLQVRQWKRGPAWLNQHLFRVLPVKGINKGWLFYALNTATRLFEPYMHGSAMTHITQPMMKAVRIPVPDIHVQEDVSKELDELWRKTDCLTRRLEKQIKLLTEHRQALITAAVTGEVEVAGASRGSGR